MTSSQLQSEAIDQLSETLTETTHELAVIASMDEEAPQAEVAFKAMQHAKRRMERVLALLER